MKTLLQLGLTLAACTFATVASAQNETPGNPPGTPATPGSPPKPADPTRPETDRDHKVAPKPASEEDFVRTAAKKGAAEVKLAQLGVQKAEDAKVKELAERLVRDHTAANADLKPIADKLGIKTGEQADDKTDDKSEKADEKAEQKYRELNARTGKEFDRAFVEHMAMCHEKGVAWYEAGRNVAKSEQVTAYIDKTLPVLRAHAAKIRELNTGARPDAGTTPGSTNPRPNDPQPDTRR